MISFHGLVIYEELIPESTITTIFTISKEFSYLLENVLSGMLLIGTKNPLEKVRTVNQCKEKIVKPLKDLGGDEMQEKKHRDRFIWAAMPNGKPERSGP